jgi:hypothetical protein
MKQYQKRERVLEEELEKFMDTFGDMKVTSRCEEATHNVRNRIKE